MVNALVDEVQLCIAVETLAVALFESDVRVTAVHGAPSGTVFYRHDGWISTPADIKARYRDQAIAMTREARDYFGKSK